jgi:hypothetical protein
MTSHEYYDKYLKSASDARCMECGKDTTFVNLTSGYRKFCSSSCANNSKDVQDRKKSTCIKNYGVESPLKSDSVKNKLKATNLHKYGYEWGLKSDSVKNKRVSTNIEKYGYEHAILNKDINSKKPKTKHPTLEEVKEYFKEKQTFIDPEAFFYHYETNGWVQGKGKPIKNWEAAVRYWQSNNRLDNFTKKSNNQVSPYCKCGRLVDKGKCGVCDV